MTWEFLQCPYCDEFKGGHGVRVPKTIGKYRIKRAGESVIVLQCQRCSKSFRIRMMGDLLLWDDMTGLEKKAFKVEKWRGIK